MTRIDGPGNVPQRNPRSESKSQAEKPKGASFDDVLDEKHESEGDEKKKSDGKTSPFPGGLFRMNPGGRDASAGGGGTASGGEQGAGSFEYERSSGERGADRASERTADRKAEERRDADRKDDRSKEPSSIGNEVRDAAKAAQIAQSQQKSSEVRVSQEMMQKMVDTVRVGQNRAGNTEIQMDLKATVFDGMSMKMSKGPEGLMAVLTVDQISAKQALEAQVSELIGRLESQGIDVAEIRVELREESSQLGGSGDGGEAGDEREGGEADQFGYDADAPESGAPGVAGRGRPGQTPPAGKPRRKESNTDYSI